ncbi:MAG: tetratricopeptide repeat protein [Mariprofundaceae bacterium]
MISSILKILLLACMLNACVPAKHTTLAGSISRDKATAAPINQRSSSFLYLAARAAIYDKQINLAQQFLSVLVKRLDQPNLENSNDSFLPRIELIKLLLQTKQSNIALQQITPLIKHFPILTNSHKDIQELHLLYARTLAANSQTSNALDHLTKLLNLHPNFERASQLQISLYIFNKQFDLAHIATNTAIKNLETARLHQYQAEIYTKQGKFKQALKSLKNMQKLAPNSSTPILLQSQLAIQQQHLTQAEEVLRQGMMSLPKAWNIQVTLARLLSQTNRRQEAIVLYQKLNKNISANPEIKSALGMIYYQQKDFKLALKQFKSALSLAPKQSSYQFYTAASLEAMQQNELAKHAYKKITSTSPLWQETQLRIANMDARLKNYPVARQRILQLLRSFPNNPHAWDLLSTTYLAQQQFQELISATNQALDLKHPPARLLLNRAIAFEHFKRYNDVEKTLQKLIKLNPDHAEGLNFIAYIYAEQGIKLKQAETYINHALSIKPNDGYYLDSQAWVFYKQGKYSQSLKAQQSALKIIQDDSVMHEHFGDILWKLDDHKAAIQAWKKALTLEPKEAKRLHTKIKHGL